MTRTEEGMAVTIGGGSGRIGGFAFALVVAIGMMIPAGASALTETSTSPSIFFDDTQDEDCSPAWDWRVQAQGGTADNDFNNFYDIGGVGEGGANGTCGVTYSLFRINHDGSNDFTSPVDSFRAFAQGDVQLAENTVGIQKAQSRVFINSLTGGGPAALRFQDTSQAWQFTNVGSGDDFTLQDGTNTSVLTVEDDESPGSFLRGLGVFEGNPEARLQVTNPSFGTNSDQLLRLEDNQGTPGGQVLADFVNNGGVSARFVDTNGATNNWQFGSLDTGSWVMNQNGQLPSRLQLFPNGNLQIAGTYLQASDRRFKEEIAAVSSEDLLEKVSSLPIRSWVYKDDKDEGVHLGPMSGRWAKTFGLGDDPRFIAPGDMAGVALGAIQALEAENAELEQRIEALERAK